MNFSKNYSYLAKLTNIIRKHLSKKFKQTFLAKYILIYPKRLKVIIFCLKIIFQPIFVRFTKVLPNLQYFSK
jgi:predicted transcriptional regulator